MGNFKIITPVIEIDAARWKNLAEITIDTDYSKMTAAIKKFAKFEYWFKKYHSHVLLTEWFWNRETTEPYVFIEKHGVFSNLNKLAQRIMNEVFHQLENKKDNFKLTLHSSNSEVLQINMPWKNRYISCEFISLDDTKEDIQESEGWKFDIIN